MTIIAAKENIFKFTLQCNTGSNDGFDTIKLEFKVTDSDGTDEGFASNLGGYNDGDEVPCWIISTTNLVERSSGSTSCYYELGLKADSQSRIPAYINIKGL